MVREERAAPELVTDYLVHRFALAGTPEEYLQRVKELEEAGVDHIMVTLLNAHFHEVMEAWASRVMGRFI